MRRPDSGGAESIAAIAGRTTACPPAIQNAAAATITPATQKLGLARFGFAAGQGAVGMAAQHVHSIELRHIRGISGRWPQEYLVRASVRSFAGVQRHKLRIHHIVDRKWCDWARVPNARWPRGAVSAFDMEALLSSKS